ncbi:MAG: hypothetical protein ACQERJ_04840, partial [Bacillota bacterium]
MLHKIDFDLRYEYTYTLCKPDQTPLLILSSDFLKNEKYNAAYPTTDTLELEISHESEFWKQVKGDYLILMERKIGEEIIDEKYFIISNPVLNAARDDSTSIMCYSREHELNKKIVRGYNALSRRIYVDPSKPLDPNVPEGEDSTEVEREGSDGFEDNQGYIGVINYIETLSSWRLGEIDSSLMKDNKAFDINEKTILTFLTEDVMDAYECVFIFNTSNKTFDVRALENVGDNKFFYLTDQNYIESLKIEEKHEDIATKVHFLGSQGITIHGKNPTGQSFLTNFNFYKNSDYMSQGLIDSLDAYDVKIQDQEGVYEQHLLELEALNSQKTTLENDLSELENQLNQLESEQDLAIQFPDTVKPERTLEMITADLEAKEIEIENKKGEIATKKSEIEHRKDLIQDFRFSISMETNFTSDELAELDYYTKEKVWSNQSYQTEEDLWQRAVKVMQEIAYPPIEFSINVSDFTKIAEFQEDWRKLNLADTGIIEHERLDFNAQVRLVGYSHDIKNGSLQLEFSNKQYLKNDLMTLADMLKKTISSSTAVDMSKHVWDKGQENFDQIEEIRNRDLDAARNKILAGADQNVVMDDRGLLLSAKDNDLEQIRAINNVIAFTEDGWKTAALAITPKGVFAPAVYGDLIAGSKLTIGNQTRTFMIDSNGAQMADRDENGDIIYDGQGNIQYTNVQTKLNVLDDKIVAAVSEIEEEVTKQLPHLIVLGNTSQSFAVSSNSYTVTEVNIGTSINTFKGTTLIPGSITNLRVVGPLDQPISAGTLTSINPSSTNNYHGEVNWNIPNGTSLPEPWGKIKFDVTVDIGNPEENTYPREISWSAAQAGPQGPQGPEGEQGLQGPEGTSTYTHIAYANNSTGTDGFSLTESTDKIYIGIYVDENQASPTDPSLYNWTLIKGADGEQGIAGPKGEDGQTSYLHIAYADNSTGTLNFSHSDSTNRLYIGQYTDFTQTSSSNPADYNWSRIKGEKGDQGDQGVEGPPGDDGQSLYTWIKYANDAQGNGFTDDPDGKSYIGISYNNASSIESEVPTDYTWTKIEGDQGIVGPKGEDGQTTYTWIKYADSPTSGMSDISDGKRYLGIAYNKTTISESNNYDDYEWSLIEGPQGPQGVEGPKGENGESLYTWIKYADDDEGTGLSDFPAGKKYIGIAYNRTSSNESTNVADYTWSKVEGDQGVEGPKGEDGQTTYTWVKYADSPTSGMSDDSTGKKYLGLAYNKLVASESTNYNDYSWSLIEGPQGPEGPRGEQGIEGPKGEDGQSLYTWIKYADDDIGTEMSDYPTNKKYIGLAYNKTTPTESNTPSDYTWSKVEGDQGVEGPKGEDGQTTYTWIKYADSPTSGMSDDSTGKKYLGIAYNKTTQTESEIYSDYSWSLVQGPQGPEGIEGPKGEDGQSLYTWVRYADDEIGSGMSNLPDGKKYIGLAYNRTTPTESNTPSDYTWAKIEGDQGIQGPKGEDGEVTYTWIKYANSPTTGMSDDPTGKEYMGIAYNKTVQTESEIYSDYSWTKIKGETGEPGTDARLVDIVAENAFFKKEREINDAQDLTKDNFIITPTQITITGYSQNVSFASIPWQYSLDGADWHDLTSATAGISITTSGSTSTLVISNKWAVVTGNNDYFILKLSSSGNERATQGISVVPDEYDTERRIREAELTISSDAITLLVEEGYEGDTLVSKINQTAAEIQIQASKINLTGQVTVTDLDDSLHNDITSKAAQATLDSVLDGTYTGGTFISGTTINSPTILNNKAGMTDEGTLDSSIRFWGGDTYANRTNAPFRVTQDGSLTATKGSIAGWNITASGLESGSGTSAKGIRSNDPSAVFYAGDVDNPEAGAYFRVDENGVLHAKGAVISGMTMEFSEADENLIFKDSTDPSKQMQFGMDLVPPNTLITLKAPESGGTLAVTNHFNKPAGEIFFGTGANSLNSSNKLLWSNVTGNDVLSVDGRIGIGTTNPTEALQVIGHIKSNYSYANRYYVGTTRKDLLWDEAYTHVTSSGADHIWINQDMRTTASVNFGTLSLSDMGGSTSPGFEMKEGTSQFNIHLDSSNLNIEADEQVGTGIIMSSVGNIGLGQAPSTSYKLNINGDINTSALYIAGTRKDTVWDTHISSTGADHSYINQDIKTTANVTFNQISVTDNVGISATPSATHKLNIGGNINATGIYGTSLYIDGTRKDTVWDTHISSTGADHSYINQNVTTTGTPTFNRIDISRTGGASS